MFDLKNRLTVCLLPSTGSLWLFIESERCIFVCKSTTISLVGVSFFLLIGLRYSFPCYNCSSFSSYDACTKLNKPAESSRKCFNLMRLRYTEKHQFMRIFVTHRSIDFDEFLNNEHQTKSQSSKFGQS